MEAPVRVKRANSNVAIIPDSTQDAAHSVDPSWLENARLCDLLIGNLVVTHQQVSLWGTCSLVQVLRICSSARPRIVTNDVSTGTFMPLEPGMLAVRSISSLVACWDV